MKDLHSFLYSKEVLTFVRACKDFTDILERGDDINRDAFIIELLKILPDLYNRVINLPANEPLYEMESEKFVTEQQWSEIYQRINTILGSQNEYLDVPHEEDFDRLDIVSRDLSEDLSDVYQDIKDFIEVFRISSEEAMNDALYECRLNFENFWGEKLLRASLNLHKIMIRDEDVLKEMDREFEEKPAKKVIKTHEWFLSKRQNDTRRNGKL